MCCGVEGGGCVLGACVHVSLTSLLGWALCVPGAHPPPPPSPSLAMVSIVGFKVWGVLNHACYAVSCFVFGLCGATRCDWCAAHQSCCCGRRLLARAVEVVLAARCVVAAHPHINVHASLYLVVNQILVLQSWVSSGRLVVHVVTGLDLFSCAWTGFTMYIRMLHVDSLCVFDACRPVLMCVCAGPPSVHES
jgi:hypothetical protein